MADLDELAAGFERLSKDYYGDKRKARENDFFSRYGDRFSNDRSIGLAILQELDDRGIDTSAADEAVQEIIDTLIGECDGLRSKLKSVQRDLDLQEEKLEKVQDAIDSAVSGNSETSKENDLPPDEGMGEGEMPPDAGAGAPPPDAGEMPPDAGAGTPPPDTGEVPPDTGEMPPDAGAGAPPPDTGEMPPQTVPSDARIKNVRACLSNARANRIKRRENSFTPSLGMIQAAQSGWGQ